MKIKNRILNSPYVALVFAVLFWSGNFIVGRALKGDIPPIQLNFLRWVIAMIILLPLSHRQLRKYWNEVIRCWKLIVALGLTGVASFHIFVYQALINTTAINALIFLSLSPIVIVFSSWMFFKESISSVQIGGMIMSIIGVSILITRGCPSNLIHLVFNKGDIWMSFAVPLWAAYTILLKQKPAQLPQIVLLTSSIFAGLVMMFPVFVNSLIVHQKLSMNYSHFMGILYIGIFASVLSFLFWNYGVVRIGPNKAGMYMHLMPLFGAVLSIWVLGEGLALFHIYGAVFVFIGIFLTNWDQIHKSSKKRSIKVIHKK